MDDLVMMLLIGGGCGLVLLFARLCSRLLTRGKQVGS